MVDNKYMTKEQLLTKEQLEARNKLFYKLWQDFKNRWTMKQLAIMVNCPLPTFYEIIRNERKAQEGNQKVGREIEVSDK